jgi:hypothetical protein
MEVLELVYTRERMIRVHIVDNSGTLKVFDLRPFDLEVKSAPSEKAVAVVEQAVDWP